MAGAFDQVVCGLAVATFERSWAPRERLPAERVPMAPARSKAKRVRKAARPGREVGSLPGVPFCKLDKAGNDVYEARVRLGLTQDTVAELTGLSVYALHRAESGLAKAGKFEAILRAVRALGA
jgi:DNA-binding XRE family transcriptional regulator